MFDKITVPLLEKNNFKLPLLSLLSFSMQIYDERFFAYDLVEKKLISLTLLPQNNEFINFNELDTKSKKN